MIIRDVVEYILSVDINNLIFNYTLLRENRL